ncbi:MAG: RNA polymerase sigma factor, partial [Nitrospinales bacterium]
MLNSNKIDAELWIDRYADQMYRYSLARVKDPDAAEEIVQATFLAAFKSIDSFAGQS